MALSFGEKIKSARKLKKLTQRQLADKIGAAHNSISDWENDKNKPDPDTIELLCGVLDITPNYLLASSSEDFSPDEKLIIKKYRTLDSRGREHVDTILQWEFERITQLQQATTSVPTTTAIQQKRLIQYYQRLASAGSGQVVFDGVPVESLEIPDKPKYRRVSYAVGVNGQSMEPLYEDGDILLVEPTCQIEQGEVGIFIVGDKAYVKKLGETELISVNVEYDNIPLTEDTKCMGRVVDKLSLQQ